MPEHNDLLVEIGTEELPPKALQGLSKSFSSEIIAGLKNAELACGEIKIFAAPRRLAVWIQAVALQQADKNIERRGPALTAAFDDSGNPTKAAQGFAQSCGVNVDDLERMENKKGSWLCFRSEQKGAAARELLPSIISDALAKLPIPKWMRWGAGDAEFVRPVHWIILLHGGDIVPAEILGISASNQTRGHRFHHPETLTILEPSSYATLLEERGYVIADFEQRKEIVRKQVIAKGQELGGEAVIDVDLLDEVTALVEWPVALAGRFEEKFLEVPHEALISTMEDNQKYFSVVDGKGDLLPHFITVANIESSDPGKIIEGNERVIRPRFADAAFFWEQDRKQTLESRIESLKSVTFQKKLGSLHDKSERVRMLASEIAASIGADVNQSRRAAQLCKCDLMTDMVGEFPKLQGIAGRYYAQHDGEPEAVATALEEQYLPRQAGDSLPSKGVAQSLALADRIDTLTGIFGIGQKPTGARDPFALRRASLAVLRILIEGELDLDLQSLLQTAESSLQGKIEAEKSGEDCLDYILDRLKAYYLDQGISADVIDAVMAQRPTRPLDFHHRIQAVSVFRKLPEAASLASANKRIRNILRKVDGVLPSSIDNKLLVEPAEQALFENVHTLEADVSVLFDEGKYEPALFRLAGLRESVDKFFDDVMVMSEDEALKNNRLALLNKLGNLFLRAADLSRLQH
ncbi:MAG: glycine--tRNA ligase subunit beta [Thiothrix sp.]|nr:MAG: glycine--tRNA ligase subunit beta [Thiothrix sp.]